MDSEEKKEQKDWKRFQKIMNTPLDNISENDLAWAESQDNYNSWASKQIFQEEIKRRKNGQKIL